MAAILRRLILPSVLSPLLPPSPPVWRRRRRCRPVLAIPPAAIAYLLMTRQFVAGLTAGAVKG